MSKMKWNESLTSESIQEELEHFKKYDEKRKKKKSIVQGIGIVLVIAALAAVILLPVLRIYGTTMSPTLKQGDIVVSVKSQEIRQGDLVSFYFNNNILVKRVIACGGDWVDIDQQGNVSVNGVVLDEPYAPEKAYGKCDIILPYQVPEGSFFVMGDERLTSTDSRSKRIGPVTNEKVIGKIVIRLWPLNKLGKLE